MAITDLYHSTNTIGSTEFSLTGFTTTIQARTSDGVYGGWVDLTTMAAGDQYAFYLREKVLSGSSQGAALLGVRTGKQTGPFIIAPFQLMHGWDITAAKLSGTDRSIRSSIRELASSAIVESYTLSAVSVTGTELSITNGDTSIQSQTGKKVISIFVSDRGNMTAADTFALYLREKIDGGTQRQKLLAEIAGVQGGPLVTPAFIVGDGWDVTLKKLVGTNRAFDASIRAAA